MPAARKPPFHFESHLRRHTGPRQRLNWTFFFTRGGTVRPGLLEACRDHPEASIPHFFTPYLVPASAVFDDDETWTRLETWLGENCKRPWLPLGHGIAFMDQADAALFTLWRPVLLGEPAAGEDG